MTDPAGLPPPRVVLAPNLIGRSFFDSSSLRVLEYWRDGRITPVVNRDLLLRYLKMLRALGASDSTTRRWLWWFTAAEKTLYLKELNLPGLDGYQLCASLAKQTTSKSVIWAGNDNSLDPKIRGGIETVEWITASNYTENL
ncbi:MAG: hypothetical protein O2960_17030 [Verrucomicrobia bacterium]|nr:hypothetical protein [Verrucomicrobiota bacterium]